MGYADDVCEVYSPYNVAGDPLKFTRKVADLQQKFQRLTLSDTVLKI